MDQRQTVELAALVSAYSADLIEGTMRIPDPPLRSYWLNSRRRLGGWLRLLNESTTDSIAAARVSSVNSWRRKRPILEDVFVSEILTRVWAAILTASDRRRRISHAEPIARSALVGHLEARHLALSRVLDTPGVSRNELAEVDRLRRRTERWTDLLLGHLVKSHDVADFAFDARRAADFGDEQLAASPLVAHQPVWDLLLASLRLSFPNRSQGDPRDPLSEQTHRAIISSIFGCFPSDAFQGDGLLKSVSVLRVARSGLNPESPQYGPITTDSDS